MIVDVLRSCYRTNMDFYGDRSKLAMVQWYFCDPGALPLPFPTVFCSRNWDPDPKGDSPLGEIIGQPRIYSKGANTGSATGQGPPCGSPDEWMGLNLVPPLTPTPVDLYGTPTCCPRKATPFLSAVCADATKPTWDLYTFTANGITGASPCPLFNGTWTLRRFQPCSWSTSGGFGPPPGGGAYWTMQMGPTDSATLAANFGIAGEYFGYGATGVRDFTVPFIMRSDPPRAPCSGWPTAITLYPGLETPLPLIGSIAWDCGVDAIPAQYLLCDGSAVSRSVYSLLFGRIGVTFGPGDGLTTFNLPDLRGKTQVGSGGAYATGNAIGNDSPSLSSGQLPAGAPVTITDPGHAHPSGGSSNFWATSGLGSSTLQTAGSGPVIAQQSLTHVASTGLSAVVQGGSTPLDVRQSSLALRPLIFAGQ